MIGRPGLLLALLLAGPALAQAPQPSAGAGSPERQAAAPETGPSRGSNDGGAQPSQAQSPQAPATPPGAPAAGAPERQAPVPEVGAGRGAPGNAGTGNAPVPESTLPGASTPSQRPVAPMPERAPTPVAPPGPAPAPFTDRGQLDASELELRAALRGEHIAGRITIPDGKAASLIQPEGRDWRHTHNVTVPWIGGVAVVGMFALLALFLLVRGRLRPEHGMSGRKMNRFNWFERFVHWMTSGSFVVLALTGLNYVFGRYLVAPLVEPQTFTDFTMATKAVHNFVGFPFTVGIALMFLVWVRDNIPDRLDLDWIRKGGGFIGRGHPPAKRFNFGQKMVFWITVGGGGLVAISGYFLLFPFWVLDMQGQQWSQVIHGALSLLMTAAMLAHIYIGSVGMEGAVEAMTQGVVDTNWAREHHSLWVEEEMEKARAMVAPPGASRGARPAGAD